MRLMPALPSVTSEARRAIRRDDATRIAAAVLLTLAAWIAGLSPAPADQPFFDSVVRRVGAKVARRAVPVPFAAMP